MRQRDALGASARCSPNEVRAGAGRPQAGRAELLRGHPAPSHPGRDGTAHGGQRAGEPHQRDGEPLRGDGAGAPAQHHRDEQDPPCPPGRPHCLHPVRDRRTRRPDDGRAGRGRGLDHPAGAEVRAVGSTSCSRLSGRPWTSSPARSRCTCPADRIRSLVAARLPGDPRRGGAESLLGQGDMLFRPVGSSKVERIQAPTSPRTRSST